MSVNSRKRKRYHTREDDTVLVDSPPWIGTSKLQDIRHSTISSIACASRVPLIATKLPKKQMFKKSSCNKDTAEEVPSRTLSSTIAAYVASTKTISPPRINTSKESSSSPMSPNIESSPIVPSSPPAIIPSSPSMSPNMESSPAIIPSSPSISPNIESSPAIIPSTPPPSLPLISTTHHLNAPSSPPSNDTHCDVDQPICQEEWIQEKSRECTQVIDEMIHCLTVFKNVTKKKGFVWLLQELVRDTAEWFKDLNSTSIDDHFFPEICSYWCQRCQEVFGDLDLVNIQSFDSDIKSFLEEERGSLSLGEILLAEAEEKKIYQQKEQIWNLIENLQLQLLRKHDYIILLCDMFITEHTYFINS